MNNESKYKNEIFVNINELYIQQEQKKRIRKQNENCKTAISQFKEKETFKTGQTMICKATLEENIVHVIVIIDK